MKEWVPADMFGCCWYYGDSLLYRSCEDALWKGSVRGYTVIVEPTMRRAAEQLMAMEDDPLIN